MRVYLLMPLLLWLTDVTTRRAAIVNVSSILLLLFFFFGGKFYNGWDWVNYERYFDCVPALGSVWESCVSRGTWEVGFDFLNRAVKTISDNVQVLYMVIAAFQIGALFAVSRRFGYRFAVLAFVWVVTLGWALWMQVLRQGLAVSCLLLAAVLLSNRRTAWAALLAAVAVLFHYSAVLPVLLALVAIARGRFQKIVLALLLAGGLYALAFLVPDYVSGKADSYAGAVGFSLTRLLRYFLFAPLLYLVWRQRDWLREMFGPVLFDVGRYLIVATIVLLPFASLTWATRLIVYGMVPLVLAGALLLSANRVHQTFRWLAVAPLLLVYAYSYVEPLNRLDVQPMDNYFLRSLSGDDITYSEAFNTLNERLCDIDRCG